MKTMRATPLLTLTAVALTCIPVCPASTQTPSFQWAKRVANTANPNDELSIGLAVDSQANCYVTGWFDGERKVFRSSSVAIAFGISPCHSLLPVPFFPWPRPTSRPGPGGASQGAKGTKRKPAPAIPHA